MYQPKSSGLLKSGGFRHFKRRRSVIHHYALAHQIPDIHISDAKAIREKVWDFDPLWEFEYSQRELMLMAEKILLNDPKHWSEGPYWLPAAVLIQRAKREIFVGNGIPDPAVASGLYWRTHPEGRTVNKAFGSNGGGFYQ